MPRMSTPIQYIHADENMLVEKIYHKWRTSVPFLFSGSRRSERPAGENDKVPAKGAFKNIAPTAFGTAAISPDRFGKTRIGLMIQTASV